MSRECSFKDCPVHKYLVIPFFNIFTFGIYGNMYWLKKLEDQHTAIMEKYKTRK
jgi:hypothetical protein